MKTPIVMITERMTAAYERAWSLRPPPGTIPVGSEHTRAEAEADSLRVFLRAIHSGKSPLEALTIARENFALWAKNWNKSRKDRQVHIGVPLSDEMAPHYLWWAVRLFTQPVSQVVQQFPDHDESRSASPSDSETLRT